MTKVRLFVSRITKVTAHLAVAVALVTAFFTAMPTYAATAPASYSCGAYGQGNYSYTNGAADCNGGTVGAPNTGFAGFASKLTQPSSLMAIIGSLLLIIVGITVMLKMRHKKPAVGFDRTDN